MREKRKKKKDFRKTKRKETIKEREYHEGEAWELRLSLQGGGWEGGREEGGSGKGRILLGAKNERCFTLPKLI